MNRLWVGYGALFALGWSSLAAAFEVPLQYTTKPKTMDTHQLTFGVTSVKVAPFDMLAAGAPAPPMEIDLGASDKGKGLERFENNWCTRTEMGGRTCVRTALGKTVDISVDDTLVYDSNKPELYILVEYFDEGTSGSRIGVAYDSLTSPFKIDQGSIPFENTRGWKKHQFHITDARFANRQNLGKSDFRVLALQPVEGSSAVPADFSNCISGYSSCQFRREAPEGQYKLPTPSYKIPLYFTVKLGERERLAILDRRDSQSGFYDTLYFDNNGNRDLTDDTSYTGVLNGKTEVRFSGIDTTVESQGKTLPYSFGMMMYNTGSAPAGSALGEYPRFYYGLLMPNAAYRGQFEFEGQRYQIALSDYNCNGCFGDTFDKVGDRGPQRYFSGDYLYMTKGKWSDVEDSLILGDVLVLGGKPLAVKVDIPANKMTLTPIEAKLATLKPSTSFGVLQLYAEDTSHSVAVPFACEQMQLPEGEYRIHSYSMSRSDEKGGMWKLDASESPDMTGVKLEAGKSAELKFGEPYKPQVTGNIYGSSLVEPSQQSRGWYEFWKGNSSSNVSVQLSLELRGAANERISGIRLTTGTAACEVSKRTPMYPKEPSYKLVTADGEVAAQGNFEYG